jgi:hypothetical protein
MTGSNRRFFIGGWAMKITAWFVAELPFMVMLAFTGMNLWVEIGSNRLDLLPANIPIIVLLIVYLVFRRHDAAH